MDPIVLLAREHGLRIIEDDAQAIGALYKGRTTGSFGDISCISFYPTKNLGACGDAGMLVTKQLKSWRNAYVACVRTARSNAIIMRSLA